MLYAKYKAMTKFKIPAAETSIKKGVPLKELLGKVAIEQLATNIEIVYPDFPRKKFVGDCLQQIETLSLTQRSHHIACMLKRHLPTPYSKALNILLQTIGPELEKTSDNGLAPMFYMPHCHFIGNYGLDSDYNHGEDPFDISMQAQYELTKRFTCEFSIRPFLEAQQEKTLKILYQWMKDPNPHIRRLCSEGTRPRLPWAKKLSSFVDDPTPCLPILELLKTDPDLYVRRSVANHMGDIAKDHIDLALDLCEAWLTNANKELKWVIRHALRNPVKKGNHQAIELRKRAS